MKNGIKKLIKYYYETCDEGDKVMSEITELLTNEDLDNMWKTSSEQLVFLFKKSTTCPLSADAFEIFQEFLNTTDKDFKPYFVKVRETREISNQIAEVTNVRHHSPQVLLIKDKEVLFHTSHTRITVDSLTEAIEKASN